jgi:hypothetical protein
MSDIFGSLHISAGDDASWTSQHTTRLAKMFVMLQQALLVSAAVMCHSWNTWFWGSVVFLPS